MTTKYCPRCKRTLSTDLFGKVRSRYDGLSGYCLECKRERKRERYQTEDEYRERLREYQREYGSSYEGARKRCQANIRRLDFKEFTISDVDWDAHWHSTECKVCGKELPIGVAKHKHYDHQHGTSIYRGTLCSGCNRALGLCKDSPTILMSLAEYILGIN